MGRGPWQPRKRGGSVPSLLRHASGVGKNGNESPRSVSPEADTVFGHEGRGKQQHLQQTSQGEVYLHDWQWFYGVFKKTGGPKPGNGPDLRSSVRASKKIRNLSETGGYANFTLRKSGTAFWP